ncbi:MvaI/BcnI family restriction endonuclease [Flavihumibacter sp. ZG627]|uniref:MvaI/BcnI family restriction endonuclease n=1 Tax=Flavihumibacter sp. ZG627 TaxID=1463156 RepID=UPI000ABFAAA4|nr:MvaI/BcnI family restriction endonuclease [Flavihumibacter sp. ZG627]
MNPLFKPNDEESIVIEFINNYNLNEFALIRMTQTMIDKAIIDASESLRKILFDKKLVSFKDLIPGGAKEYKDAIIITDTIVETKVSFYRPKTKQGDPRFWPYNLKRFVEEGDLVYMTISNNTLIAIPIKTIEQISRTINDVFEDPENQKVIVQLKKDLSLLKQSGAIESIVPNKRAPKDVGLTLESFLGVKVNSLKTPDYLGKIELKSKRQGRTKDSLFSKVPDKDISKYKTVRSIIDKFGMIDSQNRKALYNNIITKPNSHGLYLVPDNEKMILNQMYLNNSFHDDVCAWHYKTLRNSLEIKHPTTLWVDAIEEVNKEGNITFTFINFELTTKPLFSEFISLIERDLINFDWKGHITNGKKRDHGPGFRIDKANRKYLFKTLININ